MSKKFAGFLVLVSSLMLFAMISSVGAATPSASFEPTSVPLPNLTFKDVVFKTNCDQSANVIVKIVNQGYKTQDTFDVTLTADNQTYTATIYGLGTLEPLDIDFEDLPMASGTVVAVTLDPTGQLSEGNEADNNRTVTYTASGCVEEKPDLAVMGVYAPDCDRMGISVDIENYGTANSPASELSITVGGQTYTRAIQPLSPNTIDHVMFPELAYTTDTVTVVVDTLNQVAESDENNTFTLTMEKVWWLCFEPTPVPQSEELLENGDFEIGESRTVSDWKVNNLKQNDYRVCNDTTAQVAFGGQCAFQFKGASNQPRILLQNTKPNISSGTLKFSGWIETRNLEAGAKVIMIVRYQDGTRERVVVRPALNTTPYTQFNEYHAVRGPVAAVKVQVKAAQNGGLFRVDGLSVRHER